MIHLYIYVIAMTSHFLFWAVKQRPYLRNSQSQCRSRSMMSEMTLQKIISHNICLCFFDEEFLEITCSPWVVGNCRMATVFVPDGMSGMSGLCDVTRYQGDTKGLLFSSSYVNIVLFSTHTKEWWRLMTSEKNVWNVTWHLMTSKENVTSQWWRVGV